MENKGTYIKANNVNKEQEERIITIGVFAFFIFTMVCNLMHSSLWGDEWCEYIYSQWEIEGGGLYRGIIRTFQPPLYNFVMHFWLKISDNVLWFRLFNVFIGFLGGILVYKTVSRLCNKLAAYVTVVALAACYQWVYCIQECSEYAIMLVFLFLAIYFYVVCFQSFSYWKLAGFIVACVGSIYSQYGSVFVALPLLLMFYVGNVFSKQVELKRKIIITVSYVLSLLCFALPLYVFFLQKQMENNQIGSDTVTLNFALCKDVLFTLGRILEYFFTVNTGEAWEWLGGALTIALLVLSILLIVKKKMNWIGKSLIICMWMGYFAHYFLVQLHIYAMVHPNESAGFYARYSYFYIPIFCVVLPVLFYELWNWDIDLKKNNLLLLLAGAGILCLLLSYYTLMQNWYKAKDDQYAEIWMENNGWEDPTYLFGMAEYGFEYYVSHSEGYQEGYLNNSTTSPDINNLPPRFWLWRTNWGGNDWQTFVNKANELGYTVTVFDDSGYAGQLAYCSYDS